MLTKLISHEWKDTFKVPVLLLTITVLLSAASLVYFSVADQATADIDLNVRNFVLYIAYILILSGLSMILTIYFAIRFYKNLYTDEGYLMHTLPVRSWQLVLSKLICALATTVVNGIVGILAMFLMMPLNWDEIFDTQLWQAVFRNLVQQPDIILYFLEFLLLLLVMCAAMFMNFYLAMSIGHLFSRRRILMSVVAFFGLNILDSVITSTLHNMDMMNWLYGMDLSDHAGYWLGILLLLIPTVIMFLLTSWILKHKLNLE